MPTRFATQFWRCRAALNLKMGGMGIIPPLTKEEILAARMPYLWPAHPDPAEHNRRSIYLQMKRSMTLPMLQIFDAPDTATSCPQPRNVHGRAPGPGTDEQRVHSGAGGTVCSARFANRPATNPEAQVETGGAGAFGRPPFG